MNILLQESADILKEYFGERLDKMVVERAVFGLFFSGVKLSTGHGGLCFTPVKEIPEAVCCPSSAKAMPLSGKLGGRSVKSYLDDLSHANILRKTLAIATLNALSACYWEENKSLEYKIEIDVDSFDVMEVHQGRKSVVIGALVPMLKKLLAADADFKVLEMDSRTLRARSWSILHLQRMRICICRIPTWMLLQALLFLMIHYLIYWLCVNPVPIFWSQVRLPV